MSDSFVVGALLGVTIGVIIALLDDAIPFIRGLLGKRRKN